MAQQLSAMDVIRLTEEAKQEPRWYQIGAFAKYEEDQDDLYIPSQEEKEQVNTFNYLSLRNSIICMLSHLKLIICKNY
jgi:hypothetical protein